MRRLFTTDNVDVDYEERGSMVSHLYGNSGQHVGDSHFPGSESVQASSVLSQSHERLGQSTDTPSLLSLVVVMSDGKPQIYFEIYYFVYERRRRNLIY